jgi:L-amino acid N-acyltransferase YncA
VKNLLNAIVRFVFGLRRPSKATNTRALHQRGESLQSFVIREATADDIPALAEVHVKAWSDTYRTVMNPPTYEIRERQWREQFEKIDASWFCFVVENHKGDLVGFAKGRSYASDDLPGYSGELNKIYLLREYQRLGLGRRLVGHVARRFLAQGISTMVLFGTPQNPSCAFHEALGGERLFATNGEFHGGYGWLDLQTLATICPIEPFQDAAPRERIRSREEADSRG